MSRLVKSFMVAICGSILFSAVFAGAVENSAPVTESVKLAPKSVGWDAAEPLPDGLSSWDLFDGNGGTTVAPLAAVRLVVELSQLETVTRIRQFGSADYRLNVYRDQDWGWETIPSLTALSNDGTTPAWKTFTAGETVAVDRLLFELIPVADGDSVGSSAGIGEIEIWGEVAGVEEGEVGSTLDSLESIDKVNALLARDLPHIGEIAASPALLSLAENEIAVATFTFEQNPILFKRAYLLYDGYNLPRTVSAQRRINGLSWGGGFDLPEIDESPASWIPIMEEINPAWLVEGENRLEFRSGVENAKLRNIRLAVETDSGWNTVSALSDPSVYDTDLASGLAIPSVGSTNVQIEFKQIVQPELLKLHLSAVATGTARIEYRTDTVWKDIQSGWRIDLSTFRAGWNQIVLPAVDVRALRVTFSADENVVAGAPPAVVSEIRVCSSPAGSADTEPRIVVSYPRNGEYFGRTAYLQGFVVPSENAAVSIEGRAVQGDARDGSFSLALSKDETRYAVQEDDQAWEATVSAAYPPDLADGERFSHRSSNIAGVTETLVLNRNMAVRAEEEIPAEEEPVVEETEPEVAALIKEKHSVKIAPGQAKKISYRDVVIDIPEGAVDTETEITIVPLTVEDMADLDAGMINVTYPAAGYRFLPHGMKFKKAVKLSFGYSKNYFSSGQTDDDVQMYYYHEKARRWQTLKKVTVDPARSMVISETDHFTDIINATLVVPEHPEALSYNPNSIKDIKAADPGAGINLIEPPQANNMGDARLSYPIEIPAGRKGMQPQLAIGYNSSGGNGWLGLGWDLSVPSIGIDTRWGVPRYDEKLETETYMMAGEMLTPVAHRGELVDRSSNKQFFPRVEGGFKRIIRHGDKPSNYRWVVTDKSGVKHYYGGTESGFDPNAVLSDGPGGNIFRWALKKSVDPNGNTVVYDYQAVEDFGVAAVDGRVPGRQLYLKHINYTGYQGGIGKYDVIFVRDGELSGQQRRADVIIDARPGFKTVTASLLKEIHVTFDGRPVRSYRLDYKSGAFAKTLLEAVVQLGEQGTVFNRHRFDYFDEITAGPDAYSGFVDGGELLKTGEDRIHAPLPPGLPSGFPSRVPSALDSSAISGSFGGSLGGHLYVGVGIYSPGKIFSIGGKGGFNVGQTEGTLALVDINGDGLPDKVFRGENGFKYRSGKLLEDGTLEYAEWPRDIVALPVISRDSSQSITFGTEGYVYVLSFLNSVTANLSVGSAYFSDVNGDGLVDLVNKGRVHFNHLVGEYPNETPTFTFDSGDTAVAVGSGQVIDGMLDDDAMLAEENTRREQSPLIDAVRIWTAPYDGRISIDGRVELVGEAPVGEWADGVKVSIQYDNGVLWSQTIEADDHSAYDYSVAPAKAVSKGDRVYFRTQSIDHGAYDDVDWAAQITYVDLPGDATDTNLLPVASYDAAEDFVLVGRQGEIEMPLKGRVRLSGAFTKRGTTSDDVRLVVLKNGEPLLTRDIAWDATNVDFEFDEEIEIGVARYESATTAKELPPLSVEELGETDLADVVEILDSLQFNIEVDSAIDMKQIAWDPELIYIETEGDIPVLDQNGDYAIRFKPLYDADLYPDHALRTPRQSWIAPEAGDLIAVPRIVFDFGAEDDPDKVRPDSELVFTIKRRGELLSKQTIPVTRGALPHPYSLATLLSDVSQGDEIYYDFSTRDPQLAPYLKSAGVGFSYVSPQQMTAPWAADAVAKIRIGMERTNPELEETVSGPVLVAALKDGEMVERRLLSLSSQSYGDVTVEIDLELERDDKLGFVLLAQNQELIDMVSRTSVTVDLSAERTWKVPTEGVYSWVSDFKVAEGESGSVLFSVVRDGEVLAENEIPVENGSLPEFDLFSVATELLADDMAVCVIQVVSGDLVLEESTCAPAADNEAAAVRLAARSNLLLEEDSEEGAEAVLYSSRNPGILSEPYRGWSYVAYNGNGSWGERAIDQNVFDLQGKEYQKVFRREKEQRHKDTRAFPLVPMPGTQQWSGLDEELKITAGGMNSSRLGLNDVRMPRSAQFAGMRAVERMSVGANMSHGGGFFLSGSVADSFVGDSLLDYMDLNGDRYPDIVGRKIQYTLATGGLCGGGDLTGSFGCNQNGGYPRRNENGSWNVGMSGNPAKSIMSARAKMSGGSPGGSTGSTEPSIGFSGGLNGGTSRVTESYLDLNGDGLPDRVYSNGDVQWNLGYRFSAREYFGFSDIDYSESAGVSIGGGYNKGKNYSAGGGVNLSDNFNYTQRSLTDINGDGLPDMVLRVDDGIKVGINTGGGFLPEKDWVGALRLSNPQPPGMNFPGVNKAVTLPANNTLMQSNTKSLGGGAYFSINIKIQVAWVQITIVINPGVNGAINTTRQELAIRDVNGDGYPDHLLSKKNSELRVALNKTGRTNLLRSVSRPLGGSFELDYHRSGNTYKQPRSRWVLNSVVVDDGHSGDGEDRLATAYRYEDGNYDRLERDFYGYGKIVEERGSVISKAYSKVVRTFLNETYYTKGLLKSEAVYDLLTNGMERQFIETINDYEMIDTATGNSLLNPNSVDASVFAQLKRTDKLFFEGQSSAGNGTYTEFDYDRYGNVTRFYDAGELSDSGVDDVLAEIEYDYRPDETWILNLPKTITVKDASNKPLRKRTGSYDSRGNLTSHSARISNSEDALTVLTYDGYGNILTVTGPENHAAQAYDLTFVYDNRVHSYVESITDSYGYTSTARYDYSFGQPLQTVDINGNKIAYRYDQFGRTQKVWGPYDIGSDTATIAFEYHPEAAPAWARTFNREYWFGDETIDTVLYVDGLKRVIQTKKEAEVLQSGAQKLYGMTLSGKAIYDALGRVSAQGQPSFRVGYSTVYSDSGQAKNATRFEYDVLGRTTKTTLPDGAFTTTGFGFEGKLFRTLVTDPERKVKKTLKDVRGSIHAVHEKLGDNWIKTRYTYDPLGQIEFVIDAAGNTTRVEYDQLGRRTLIDNPDTGVIGYGYDPAGNLISKTTPNLGNGQPIRYEYDYNRLVKIDYPHMSDVVYNYGDADAGDNQVGRIVSLANGDLMEERFYGKLGETVKTVKSIRSDNPSRMWPVYTTEYIFDSFGRMRQLTYPDGEVLTYGYDKGGLLEHAEGVKGGKEYLYLQDLAYDEFGQRKRIEYGNGVVSRYSYDPFTRRLKDLITLGGEGQILQNLDYDYDRVGNITATKNSNFITRDDQSKTVTQGYGYDDLHRLISADGNYRHSADHVDRYSSNYSYSGIGNILGKQRLHEYHNPLDGGSSRRPHTSIDFDYAYTGAQPHAVTHVDGKTYSYDSNGNLIRRVDDQTKQERLIHWNEENRITHTYDQGKETIYRYDDQGTRILKRGKYGEIVYVDPNFSIRNGEVASKHIFAGNTRLATKMVMKENRTGASKKTYIRPDDVHGHSDYYPEKSRGQHSGQEKQLDPELQKQHSGQGWVERQRKTNSGQGKGLDKAKRNANIAKNGGNTEVNLPGNSRAALENALRHGNGNKIGIYKRLDRLGYQVTADHRIVPKGTDGTDSPIDTTGPVVPEEHQIYYYHGDHLGSSNIVSDRHGRNYQHLEYFPYGENWVEETRNTTHLPYKFTGKEQDPETGLYYFGARYYDPVISTWVSVDPILGDYLKGQPNGGIYLPVHLALYGYVSQNPVVLFDPDGRAEYFSQSGVFLEAINPDDDNVYVRSMTDGETTNTSLGISIDSFHTISATVYGEGPARGRTATESTATANVINNQAERRGETMLESATSSRFFGSDNEAAQDYQTNWRQGGRSEAPAARAGVISVLSGEEDPLGGRSMFEGVNLIDNPVSTFKSQYIDTGVAHDPIDVGDTRYFRERTADEAAAFRQQNSEN
jgi:RHS repeat-associated protein